MLYYISVNLEAFLYCFTGEYLSAKVSVERKMIALLIREYLNFVFFLFQSKMIGSAAYDSLWYNFPAKESRPILFLIIRSQKRLTITSGKIIELSLERFTSVRFNLWYFLIFVRFVMWNLNFFNRLCHNNYFLKILINIKTRICCLVIVIIYRLKQNSLFLFNYWNNLNCKN